MKRILLAVVMSACMALGALAQFRPSIIVSAGYQFSNITAPVRSKYLSAPVASGGQDIDGTTNIVSGARAGVLFDIGLFSGGYINCHLQSGLSLSTKGFSIAKGHRATLYYAELPLLANLRLPFGNGYALFANVGPYVAYGLGSTYRVNGKRIKEVHLLGDNGWFSSLDWGYQCGFGFEVKRLLFTVGGQIGEYDITSGKTDVIAPNAKTYACFLTAGYRF